MKYCAPSQTDALPILRGRKAPHVRWSPEKSERTVSLEWRENGHRRFSAVSRPSAASPVNNPDGAQQGGYQQSGNQYTSYQQPPLHGQQHYGAAAGLLGPTSMQSLLLSGSLTLLYIV